MVRIRRSSGPNPSDFEKKATNIIKGKWGSLSVTERVSSMGNRFFSRFFVGAEQRHANLKQKALMRLVTKTVDQEGSSDTTQDLKNKIHQVAKKVNRLDVLQTLFARKAKKVLKGNVGWLSMRERLVHFVNRVGTVIGTEGAAGRRFEMRVNALKRMMRRELRRDKAFNANGSVEQRSQANQRILDNVYEVVDLSDLSEDEKLTVSNQLVSTLVTYRAEMISKLTSKEMGSETKNPNNVESIYGAFYSHFSKGGHPENRNEDRFSMTKNAIGLADGVSSGGEDSGRVAQLFAETSALGLEHVYRSGQLDKSPEEAGEFVQQLLVEAGHAYNARALSAAKKKK